jgi:hypothetical protein
MDNLNVLHPVVDINLVFSLLVSTQYKFMLCCRFSCTLDIKFMDVVKIYYTHKT